MKDCVTSDREERLACKHVSLDTNVLSEMIKRTPVPSVMTHFEKHEKEIVMILTFSAISELKIGTSDH